jgi:hypothetical protein
MNNGTKHWHCMQTCENGRFPSLLTFAFFVWETGVDFVVFSTLPSFRVLLRNSYTPSRGRLRQCRQDLLHHFAPLASSSWTSSVNSARRFKASENPEFIKALWTSSCSCFFLLLRCTSYGVIPLPHCALRLLGWRRLGDRALTARAWSLAMKPWQ